MLYDQAEAVMADLAERYPQRETGMVLRPREDANAPRDYACQIAHGAGSITPEEALVYEGIASAVSQQNPDLKPVGVRFDAASQIIVIFD